MLAPAMAYHDEGLNVIPVAYRDKKPAVAWDEFKTRCSTGDEVRRWFGNGNHYNIGLVHGKFGDHPYYVAIDIDHDRGIYKEVWRQFPGLSCGRIEQSGSGEGFHIPLWVEEAPKVFKDKGNKTWRTPQGNINIRLAGCQTVAPPSIHPTGGLYKFIQEGQIAYAYTLDTLIAWLDKLVPEPLKRDRPISETIRKVDSNSDTLLEAVLGYWQSCMTVFAHFGMTDEAREESDGEIRLLGNGGLLVTADHERFYNFSDEFGGGCVEAWAYCRMGNIYDKHRDFYTILCEMAEAAGIDVHLYKRKFKQSLRGDTQRWTKQYSGAFSKMRGLS
jgi:hypothetical protein